MYFGLRFWLRGTTMQGRFAAPKLGPLLFLPSLIGKRFFQDEAKNDPDGSAPIGKFCPFCWAQAG